MAKPQPKPVVRFRVNGNGTQYFQEGKWYRASQDDMTTIVAILHNMTRFA